MKQKSKPATPSFDRISPQHCINARIRKLHRLVNNMYMEKFRPYGIQGSMLSLLFIIGKQQHINQKTLADLLVLDPSTMSRDVKKLVGKGWIKMERAEDPRSSQLSMTGNGYGLLEEIAPLWEEMHNKLSNLLGSFSIQQIDHITAAVKGLKM